MLLKLLFFPVTLLFKVLFWIVLAPFNLMMAPVRMALKMLQLLIFVVIVVVIVVVVFVII
ncbi:MAG: hypothetical protein IIC81_07230 [Chloroflexi bacterium]|nr:hypothetical protein [Chloroflexota bacterium]MCH8088691.1 hypothetical protein [Chloroflexota bacterium]